MWIVFLICILGPLTTSFLSYSSKLYKNNRSATDRVNTLDDSNGYTETEIKNIKLFRKLMENELEKEYERSDDYLIRWLRDSDMDLNSAREALRNNLKWRKENHIDSILNQTFNTHKTDICFLDGIDNTGSQVVIVRPAVPETRKLIMRGMTVNLMNENFQCQERLLQASISADSKHITQGVVIADVQGFSVKQHACLMCMSLYQQIATTSTVYYPRLFKLFIIINAPAAAKRGIEMIIPFMGSYNKKTVKIFGEEKEEWTKYLLSVIPAEQLLQEYGGTKLKRI